MTKTAIWCRHAGDNIIGIGDDIPWNVPSDLQKFWKMVEGRQIVCGRRTYQTFPPARLEGQKIVVVTRDENFEVYDKKNQIIVSDIRVFKNWEGDIYIAGGAQIYKAFIAGGSQKLLPEIIVDCIYKGPLPAGLHGETAEIGAAVKVMEQKYRQITPDYELDGVITRIFIRKGEFVDQAVLRHLLTVIESQSPHLAGTSESL